jgi:hypothetical protein
LTGGLAAGCHVLQLRINSSSVEVSMRFVSVIAAAGMLATVMAGAAELPTRKPGLWQMTLIMDGAGKPVPTMEQCTDPETDALMMTNVSGQKGRCTEPEISSNGGTITIVSSCALPGSSSKTRAVITGDFNSAYKVEVATETRGSMPAAADRVQQTRMTLDAKWAGPCKPGQRPGDIIMPGGIKINVRDLTLPSTKPKG